mgnify:CR=1 FL=1
MFKNLSTHSKATPSSIKRAGKANTFALLCCLAKAANTEDWEKAQSAHLSIGKKEQKADVLKKKLRMNLPRNSQNTRR